MAVQFVQSTGTTIQQPEIQLFSGIPHHEC